MTDELAQALNEELERLHHLLQYFLVSESERKEVLEMIKELHQSFKSHIYIPEKL